MQTLAFAVGLALVTFVIGRSSRQGEIQQAIRDKLNAEERVSEIEELFGATLKGLRGDSALLPSLVRWLDAIERVFDEGLAVFLATKKRPARKAAQEVLEARSAARISKQELRLVSNRLDLYESLAPWLADYTDLTLEELIQPLLNDQEEHVADEGSDDPIARYVPKSDWSKLSPSPLCQRS